MRPFALCAALLAAVMLLDSAALAGDRSDLTSVLAEIEDSFVRVTRSGGFSPFRGVLHAVVCRGTTPVAKHRKRLVNYTSRLGNMALLTPKEHLALLERVEALGAFTLPDLGSGAAPPSSPRWKVEIGRGGREHSFAFSAQSAGEDTRYAAIVDAVVSLVKEHSGDVPFRNVFYEPEGMGYLDVDSRPVAAIHIDGRSLKLRTPVYTYEVEAGRHVLRMVSRKHGIDRTYDFRIEAGKTTILHLDLR